jgi:hypothetical protein
MVFQNAKAFASLPTRNHARCKQYKTRRNNIIMSMRVGMESGNIYRGKSEGVRHSLRYLGRQGDRTVGK